MSKIYLAGDSSSDVKIGKLLKKFSSKVNVYPPGTYMPGRLRTASRPSST